MTSSLKKSQIIAACALFFLIGCGNPAGDVSGSVVYNKHNPDAGALLYLVNMSDTSKIYTTTADGSGNFTFDNIPPAKYLLTVHSLNKKQPPRFVLRVILSNATNLEKIGVTIPDATAFSTATRDLELGLADSTAAGFIQDISNKHARYLGRIGTYRAFDVRKVNVTPGKNPAIVIHF